MITLGLAGCHHGHSHDHDHDHDHANGEAHDHDHESEGAEALFYYTAYTQQYELFAESDPLVVGGHAHILSHFTLLPAFTPLEEGAITLTLTVNGKSVGQTQQKPQEEGVWLFHIEPETAGEGTLEYIIKSSTGEHRILVAGVTVFTDAHEAEEAAEKSHDHRPNTTTFGKEQAWKAGLATGLPERKPFGQVIKSTAQVQPAQGEELLVTAMTDGIVSFPSGNILEGMSVSRGESLFTVAAGGLADNNFAVRYAEAKNNYEKAKADYERAVTLSEERIVSEKQLLEAETEYENARALYENLNRNFNAAGQRVASPLNGFVKQLYVTNGQYVEAGEPLVLVTHDKTLLLRAEVPLRYAAHLRTIAGATVRSPQNGTTYTLEELSGRVLSVGRAVTPGSYLIPVTLQISNQGDFIPGSFAEVWLRGLTDSRALTIPNSALIEEQGLFFVYVQINPTLFEKREVTTGTTDGISTEVLAGLDDDERVVTRGAMLVKLAQATGGLDPHAGHVH